MSKAIRKFRTVRKRKHSHPLVTLLISLMNEHKVGVMEMCEEAGIARNTFGMWGRSQSPTLAAIEACFNVVGYRLTPVPVDKDVPVYHTVSIFRKYSKKRYRTKLERIDTSGVTA